MDKKSIGKLINYERNKRKISLQQLAAGICSVSALQRLESGERMPDYFVLERVIERLGESVNKIEFLYNESAYEIYYLREVIERFLEQKNYDEAEKALAYYENRTIANEPLHRQFIYKIRAVIVSERDWNHKAAKEFLEAALEQTAPGLRIDCFEKFLLGEGELLLLLLWIQEYSQIEGKHIQRKGSQLMQYIERGCQDEEVKANVYSKAAWIFGSIAIKQQKWQEALWYTLQGEKILADNGLLVHLPQYLERILVLTEKCDSKFYIEWKKQRDALKQLYEEYEKNWECDSIELWRNYHQQEVYLESELFGQERKLISQSQEKLADALEIDQKTISRVENGKYKPKSGTFEKMKQYLQIDRDICTTRIVVDDFSLLDLEREIAKLNHYRHEAEAEVLYNQLKEKLSLKWKENVQYIKYMDVLFATEQGRMTMQEAVDACIEAFRVTRNNDIEQIDGIVLSRMEVSIINYIARCYDKTAKKEDAIKLLEKVMHAYENSKVDLKYHYVGVALIYQHLVFDYEECDRFEEGLKMCDDAIKFDLECGKGLNLGIVLEEKIYMMDRMRGDRAMSKYSYQQVYQILKLMQKERQMISLYDIYKEWYGEEIDI